MDFVQQGALIALALVLVEQPEHRAKPLRDAIGRLYGNKGAEVRGGGVSRWRAAAAGWAGLGSAGWVP